MCIYFRALYNPIISVYGENNYETETSSDVAGQTALERDKCTTCL